jgi:hypothetical protein
MCMHGVVIWGVEKREGGRMRYPLSPGSPSSEAEEEKEVAHAIPPSDRTNDSLPPTLQDTTLDRHLLETQAIIVACYSTITDQ